MRVFCCKPILVLCLLILSINTLSQNLNWAFRAGSPDIETSNTICSDNSGNIYIAGKFSGTNVDFDPSPATTFLLSSAGSTDGFVAKYNASGQFVWAFRFGSTDRDEAQGITIDQSNNIYVTGFFRGSNVDFDPNAGVAELTSNGDAGADPGYGGDIFVAKYTVGGIYQWAFNVGGTDLYDTGIGISLDGAGNVYIGGYFTLTADFDPGPGTATLNSTIGGSIFLAKYSSAGVYQWAFNLGSPFTNNSLFDIKTDGPGNVYITGYYQGNNIDFDPGPGVAPLNSNGAYEIFVAKYNANGQYQFAFSVGSSGLDVARGLGLDNNGNIYVIGDFNNTVDFDPGPGTAFLTSNGVSDAFLAKYSPTGQYIWAFGFGGTPNEYGSKLIIDNAHIFITGSFTGTADLDPSAGIENLTSAGGYDIYLGKYTLDGEYLCAFQIGGSEDDGGFALASIAPNVFCLTGVFSNTNIDFDPTAGITNLSSAGAGDIFLAKYTWPDNIKPTGTITGDNICAGEQAQLTFNATAGTGPFTVVYTDGTTDFTRTNVQSGVPFNIATSPLVTTNYTLVSVKDALRCSESNFPTGVTTMVTVNNCGSNCNNWLRLPTYQSYVRVGDLDIVGNQITVEAVFTRTTSYTGGQAWAGDLVSKHNTPSDVNYLLRPNGAEITTTNGYFNTPNICEIELNKTYHVAMTYDGATLKFYRNGFLMSSTPATGNMFQNNFQTRIGLYDAIVNNTNFIGYINEVRIWNVVRTQAQIKSYMDISLPSPTTQGGLLAYYTFDNLTNKQGNPAWNGTLGGAASINQTNPTCSFVADSCALLPCNSWLKLPNLGSKVTIGDLDVTGNQLTVEATFNRTQPLNNGIYYGNLVSKHTDQNNVNYSLLPNGCELTTTNGYKSTFQTCVLDIGKTYHVAMVYDGANLKYYRNGILRSQVPCTGNIVTNNLLTTIGQVAGGGDPLNNQFLGVINEVRIWNTARTQTQLLTNMGAALLNPSAQTGLLGYYTFDNLTNKQGNAAWNGTLNGSASLNQTNPNCPLASDLCSVIGPPVVAVFNALETVCINEPVNITNTSQNATNYYWNFCGVDPNIVPTGTNLGNMGGALSAPVFSDVVKVNGNYYVFVSNNWPGSLIRLDYGNSLLNTPTAFNLGNIGGTIPNTAEGIQVVNSNGNWYAIIVGGDANGGIPSRIVKIDFGANITNPLPVGTNWGNIGNMAYPHDLYVFQENNTWYGYTVSAQNNSIIRFNFGNNFSSPPTATNLGNIGSFSTPVGLGVMKNYMFVTNAGNSTITRLDFGTSLLNSPVGTNLGNPGNSFSNPRDISFIQICDNLLGFVVNANSNAITKLNFGTDLLNSPVSTNLGNIGGFSFPHSFSELFVENNDIYALVPNVSDNSLSRIKFSGCSTMPASTLSNPSAISYTQPGTYSITLMVDIGLPTQTSFCKQIVVEDCSDSIVINKYTEALSLDRCKNILKVSNASEFFVGDTVLIIQMKGAIVDSTNTSAFGTITDYRNAGNYEFNYIKSKTGNDIELLNAVTRQYDFADGKVQLVRVPYFQDYNVTTKLTCLPWDGSKGGVVAFNVQNNLTLNADIDVSGKGFKGGIDPFSNPAAVNCYQNQFYYPPNPDNASGKGEGIAIISSQKSFGKGALANGGGGGNSHNSGGGGGSNGNAGGTGGYNYELTPCNTTVPFDNRGIGGKTLNYNNTSNKIFMGGGGGAGQSNNPEGFQALGGNGGGIVIISANTITGNNHVVSTIGKDGLACSGLGATGCHEGMGGGGAGGSILLNVNSYVGSLNCNINGGKGGDMIVSGAGRLGPGGGGSGGILWLKSGSLPASLIANNNGGINGVNIAYANDPWGATAGQAGQTIFDLQLPIDAVPFKPNIDSVRISKTATSCSSFDFNGLGYTNTYPVSSWHWTFGDNTSANTQNVSHSYANPGNYTVKLVITDINGCKDSISTDVTATILNFDFNYEQDVCDPLLIRFNGSGSSIANPYWSFGDNNTTTGTITPVHTYTAIGTYIVKYSVGNGVCVDTVTKTISIDIQNDISLIKTADTTICLGTTKQLRTNTSLDFCWSPVTYLDNPNSTQPFTSTPENITYYFTAQITGSNLIVNGNFSQGNTGFTSEYLSSTINTTEGQYLIGTNPSAWNGGMSPCGDHTTGNGNMMMVNGSPVAGANVWKQTVAVTPNTNYAFSTWIQSLLNTNLAQLQFSINGKEIGSLITATLPTCTWTQFYTTWNSGNSNSAVISIVNKNIQLAGNDFALDDISFAPVFIKRDSVIITVDSPFVKTNEDIIVCKGEPVQLNTTGAQTYSWTPGTNLSNTSIANPIASPVTSTQYIVTGTNANGCIAKDTVNVNIHPEPVVTISNDTTICRNTSAQLFVNGGTSYSWSPPDGLNNTTIFNPVASPTDPTKYYVTITDNNDCDYLDSVTVAIKPAAIFSINAPGNICLNDSLQLNASGGNIYSWQPVTGANNPAIPNPKVSPNVTTDYTVTITETTCNESRSLSTRVTVLPLPNIQASSSNDIDCSNDRSQLLATGANDYTWTPGLGLNSNTIANPVARPAITTQYIVKGTDGSGCENYDTVMVNVSDANRGGYLMPNAFTPNGDGLNDCYGISFWGIIEEVEFSIYNRWGERIFHTTDPSRCWDGTYKGVKQNPDVFVYMITAKTNCTPSIFRKGTFVLIR